MSPSPSFPRARGARLLALAAGAAIALAFGAVAAPASAHSSLVRSSPAAGERLTEAPAQVELEFDSDLLELGAAILVVDAAGDDWAEGEPRVSGRIASIDVAGDLPADAGFEIRWRVVAEDGHPISGVVPFTVGDGEPLAGDAAADSAGDDHEGDDHDHADDADHDHADGADAADTASADPLGPVLRTVLIGAGGAALAVGLFALIMFLTRRARGPRGPGAVSH